MKALVRNRAKRGLWLEDIAEPTMGINDVLKNIIDANTLRGDVAQDGAAANSGKLTADRIVCKSMPPARAFSRTTLNKEKAFIIEDLFSCGAC